VRDNRLFGVDAGSLRRESHTRMRTKRSLLATILAGALLFALPASTSAHPDYAFDPNDIQGKTDVRGMRYDHHDGRTFLMIKTFHPLERAHLNNGNYLFGALDTRGSNIPDFYIFMEFRSGPGEYFCFIYEGMTLVRRVPADKREFSIRCDFPTQRVGSVAERYAGGAEYGNEFDAIPNSGTAVHWGGGPY
jgi:hypothetical protein